MKPCEPFANGGELLADVECPCCHSKGTMHYYKYSEILALENTVVCGAWGVVGGRINCRKAKELS